MFFQVHGRLSIWVFMVNISDLEPLKRVTVRTLMLVSISQKKKQKVYKLNIKTASNMQKNFEDHQRTFDGFYSTVQPKLLPVSLGCRWKFFLNDHRHSQSQILFTSSFITLSASSPSSSDLRFIYQKSELSHKARAILYCRGLFLIALLPNSGQREKERERVLLIDLLLEAAKGMLYRLV